MRILTRLRSARATPVGTAVAGPVAEAFGAPAVLAAGGILIVLLTAAVLLVPEVRHIQRQVTEHTDQAGPPCTNGGTASARLRPGQTRPPAPQR